METIRRSDTFIVSGEGICSSIDYQVLTLLYQPIIGNSAFNLYLTLMNLMDRQTLVSEEYIHADLESLINKNLKVIEKDRFKLEAIGLLVTFFVSDSFTYELKLPLSARSFVNDGILGQYLISAITKTRFKKILKVFKIKQPSKKQKYNISKAFNEVYPAIDCFDDTIEPNLLAGERQRFTPLKKYDFDWRLLKESIPKEVVKFSDITEAIKLKVESLSYIYGLDEFVMKDVVIRSTNENGQVQIEFLSKNARSEYRMKKPTGGNHIKLDKTPVRNAPKDPKEYFETLSPIQLLEDIGDGLVSETDLHNIEKLIDEVNINPSIVNVLVAYLARTKEGSLPGFAYLEKVAQTWKRNNINTVEVAINFIKHIESMKVKNNRKAYSKGAIDTEIDWLEDYINNNFD